MMWREWRCEGGGAEAAGKRRREAGGIRVEAPVRPLEEFIPRRFLRARYLTPPAWFDVPD